MRLALLVCYLHKPKVRILDEATASMDEGLEEYDVSSVKKNAYPYNGY